MSKTINPNFPGAVENFEDVRLDLKTWSEIEEYLTHCKAIIFPIGSTEQHGPTGAIGTDAITSEAIARELARRTGVLVTPTQSFGMAEHHLCFPGTMSLRPVTLINLIHDLVLSLLKHGFERIYFVNGHGGNIATLKASFHQIYSTALDQRIPCADKLKCKVASWFIFPEVFKYAQDLYGQQEGQHATPSEIAITLHLFPSLIEKQIALKDPSGEGAIYNRVDFKSKYTDFCN